MEVELLPKAKRSQTLNFFVSRARLELKSWDAEGLENPQDAPLPPTLHQRTMLGFFPGAMGSYGRGDAVKVDVAG